jgi:TonB family protein
LVGACLTSGQIQQCRDTDADERVNADACRRLGVRSMLVAPLVDAGQVFGILQVFSAWPNAFAERETVTLQSVAEKIVESKRQAEVGIPAAVESGNETEASLESTDQARADEKTTIFRSDHLNLAPEIISLPSTEQLRGNEVWTSILIVLVIGTAVLLGVAIGWHGAAKEVSGPATGKLAPTTVSANSKPVGDLQLPTAGADSAQPPNLGGSPNPGARPASPAATSLATGGLVVTQNGKVIYRSLPEGTTPNSTASAAANSGARLIHRVDPEYPPEAREQNLQGTVVLAVEIRGDGSIGEIGVASGDPILADAAMKAVKQWRYQPYAVNGQPVERQTRISIKFVLPQG